MLIRLQKVLSQAGIASRRHAEELILSGRVKVNDTTAQLGARIDTDCDRIFVDDQPINLNTPQTTTCLLLHKPVGVICTRSDPQSRPTIYDLLPPALHAYYYVGRLDLDSSGALLLTNSGDLANFLSHPRHHIPKTYLVWVKGMPNDRVLTQWRNGVLLEGKPTLPAQIALKQKEHDRTLLEITLQEGRNRQIRKVAAQLGHPVISLHRIAIGNLQLEGLASGKFRHLTPPELQQLQPPPNDKT